MVYFILPALLHILRHYLLRPYRQRLDGALIPAQQVIEDINGKFVLVFGDDDLVPTLAQVVGLLLVSRRFDYFELVVPDQEDETSRGFDDGLRARGERVAVAFSLTRREKEVAVLLASGMSVQQIADDIMLSRNTVKTHVSHVYQKCGVHSKEELVKLFEMHER